MHKAPPANEEKIVTAQPSRAEQLTRSLREPEERWERVLKTQSVFKTRKKFFLGGRSPRLAEKPLRLSSYEKSTIKPKKAIMSEPIYKLCLIRGYTEAYHQLSEEAQKALWEEVFKVIKAVGAEMVGPYYDCRWSNDQYDSWFMMKYPNIEAAIADTDGVRKAGLFRYMISETILGIEEKK
jgi:hypothetical protein